MRAYLAISAGARERWREIARPNAVALAYVERYSTRIVPPMPIPYNRLILPIREHAENVSLAGPS